MNQLELFSDPETVVKEQTPNEIVIDGVVYRKTGQRGRPKGSKNKSKPVRTGYVPNKTENVDTSIQVPTLPADFDPDPIVEFYSSRLVNLNGIEYLGACKARRSIANEVKYINQQVDKTEARVTQSKDHGTKHIAEVSNNS
jgi:hypothetical protein